MTTDQPAELSVAQQILKLRAELDITRRQRDMAISQCAASNKLLQEALVFLKRVRDLAEEAK